MLTPFLISAALGYLLGSLPFGYLVARRHGIDIFQHGSKNPGATNVRRVLGVKAGNQVFALDALKGAVATGWPLWLMCAQSCLAPGTAIAMAVTGLIACVIGHAFSCFTRFRGGKGVATSAGGLFMLMPLVGLIALGVWLVTFYSTRYVSLASIVAALSVPISAILLGQPTVVKVLAIALAVLVVVLHRANIGRLVQGTESRFAKKK